jgi:sugar phosphate permease
MGAAATPTTSAPTPSLGVILGLYALSMAFQGLGTSSIIKVNTAWYSVEEIGAFSGIFNVMVNSGYFLALSVSPLFVESYGFASVFYLPAGLLCAMCVLLWLFLESDPDTAAAAAHGRACRLFRASPSAAVSVASPQQVDLELTAMTTTVLTAATKVESEDDELIGRARHQEEKNAGAQKSHDMNAPRATASLPVDRRALRSPTFLAYLGCVMALCWVKDGLLSWAYEFLATSRQSELSHDTKSLLGFAVTLGGFGGGILVNFVSERMCGGARAPSLLLFSLLQGVSLVIFWFVSVGGYSDPVVATFFFLTAMFLLGNYSALNFLVPAALPHSVVATATGLFTFTGYIGSGCAGIYYMSLNSDPVESGSADRFFASWFASLCVATAATALFAEFARRRSRFKKGRRSVTDVMNNMGVDLESLFFQHPPSRRIASHKETIMAVRSAGIADEFLRGRMVRVQGGVDTTTQFFQWPERKTLPCERLEWRADPSEKDETRAFLNHRRNDPTSYFGRNDASHRRRELPRASSAAGVLFGARKTE